jgi:hypothetical protein
MPRKSARGRRCGCAASRRGVVDGAPPAGTTPILYLPGISREKLRAAEECPQELAALVELQYRGVMWLHVNGKEWTPFGFLVSKHGGLDLDVAKDQATLDALAGALPSLMAEPIAQLQGRRLDAEFFNGLVAPDATGLLLRWLSDPEAVQAAPLGCRVEGLLPAVQERMPASIRCGMAH